MYYNIVLCDNEDFVLASCPSMEIAKERLKEMYETDKQLQKYYGWEKLPQYKIIESNSMF